MYHRNITQGNGVLYPMPTPMPQATKDVSSPLPQKGQGTRIGVTPGAVIGALVGGIVAKNQIKKAEQDKLQQEYLLSKKEQPVIDGNYYNQVNTLANNLSVVFTPVSAIYVVKNGKKDFTLDTIEVGEMNQDMKNAWSAKDHEYFKGLMIGKMYTEMQIAEQAFAKRFLKKQLEMRNMITKDASDTAHIDELSEIEVIASTNAVARIFKGDEQKEALANAIVNDISDEADDMYIDATLQRPFDKYAGFVSGIKGALGFGQTDNDTLKNVERKLSDPSFVMKNIKVGFFPDRVVFTLGNQLISTLSLLSMNEEGYAHFENQDAKYFKHLFAENVKNTMRKNAEISMTYSMEKKAEETLNDTVLASDCLKDSATHPVVIYLMLTSHFGTEWLTYDIAAIERIIKTEFNLEDIPETNLNKVIAILMANQSDNPYQNAYAFEKTILSLCSKPVDFLDNQVNSVLAQDIVFTIDVLDRVTPYDDIYDNFSNEVLNYIADVLSDKEMYTYNVINIVGSPMEPAFNEMLNENILKSIANKMSAGSSNDEVDSQIKAKCEYIADNAQIILRSIRRYMMENQDLVKVNRGDLVDTIISKRGIKPEFAYLIKTQVLVNLAIDDVLSMYETTLHEQLLKFGITRP